jgi:hypothetical protein
VREGELVSDLTVGVAIPTIPPRQDLLRRAIGSVLEQQHTVNQISVAVDVNHDGAWVTRQRALDAINTDLVGFLDDDDEWYPQHVRRLVETLIECDADYVFSYWDLTRSGDVLGHFGRSFDPVDPHHTTMNVIVRTELAKQVGFTPPGAGDVASGEDWRFILGCVATGAKIIHLPEQTWYWRHHSRNTSGQPHNW